MRTTAQLIRKEDGYYCDNCLLKQLEWRAECHFCGCIFSNFEAQYLKFLDEKTQSEVLEAAHDAEQS